MVMVICLPVIVFAVVAGRAFLPGFIRHRTEAQRARTAVSMVQSVSPADVQSVRISLDGPDGSKLFLWPQPDARDIGRLIGSLKRIKFSSKGVPRLKTRTGSRSGSESRAPEVSFVGHFDPARAPIISETMRSSDLRRDHLRSSYKRKGTGARAQLMGVR